MSVHRATSPQVWSPVLPDKWTQVAFLRATRLGGEPAESYLDICGVNGGLYVMLDLVDSFVGGPSADVHILSLPKEILLVRSSCSKGNLLTELLL